MTSGYLPNPVSSGELIAEHLAGLLDPGGDNGTGRGTGQAG